MAKLVCLQAGHQNARNNCDPALRGGTGAPGEVEFTVKTRDRLSQILIQKGVQVQLVDATFNCKPEKTKDFDLFLAIHYDANIYKDAQGTLQPGGFLDTPDPSTDYATAESNRIKRAIEGEYFQHSGIQSVPSRSNANTRFYYMWRNLSAKTPCVIIECGVGQHPHDKVILADTERVANAIARGICKAFGVAFDTPTPPTPTPPATDYQKLYEGERAKVTTLTAERDHLTQKIAQIRALTD